MKNDACTTNLNAALYEYSLKGKIIHSYNELWNFLEEEIIL